MAMGHITLIMVIVIEVSGRMADQLVVGIHGLMVRKSGLSKIQQEIGIKIDW